MYDRAGRLLGANHHYRGTDALVDCTIPEDGDYFVRVHEFAYTKGDAQHFYRLSISTAPWIDAVYPPVVEPGTDGLSHCFRSKPAPRSVGSVLDHRRPRARKDEPKIQGA